MLLSPDECKWSEREWGVGSPAHVCGSVCVWCVRCARVGLLYGIQNGKIVNACVPLQWHPLPLGLWPPLPPPAEHPTGRRTDPSKGRMTMYAYVWAEQKHAARRGSLDVPFTSQACLHSFARRRACCLLFIIEPTREHAFKSLHHEHPHTCRPTSSLLFKRPISLAGVLKKQAFRKWNHECGYVFKVMYAAYIVF